MGNFRRLTKAARQNRWEEAVGLLPADDTELWAWIDELRDSQSHLIALPVLEHATKRADRPFLDQVIGWFYRENGDYPKAAEAFGRAIRDPEVLKQEGLYTAWLHNAAGMPAVALKILDQIEPMVSPTAEYWLTRAETLAKVGTREEAIEAIIAAARATDGSVTPTDIVASFTVCGGFREANEYLKTLAAPTSFDAAITLAIAHMDAGEEREAEVLLETIPETHRSAPHAYARARLLGHRERYEESLAEVRRSLQLDPHRVSASMWEAYILGQLRHFAEAEIVLRKVIKRRPLDPVANKMLGDIVNAK